VVCGGFAKWRRAAWPALVFFLVSQIDAFDWSLFESPLSSGFALKHATDELTTDTFAKHLEDNTVTAILFYAPWCFYSQQVMPAWDLASQKLQIHDPPVKLAKIDVHRYGAIGDKFGVNAFPTIKLFIDGAVFDFDAHEGRGWQQIVKWVNFHIDRDHLLKDVKDTEHFLHDNDLNVIGVFPEVYNSSVFIQTGRHFEDVLFAEAKTSTQDIPDHIARHASLVCETITVLQSRQNNKSVDLPRENLTCSGDPRNPQHADWTDKFEATVSGKRVTVRRSDKNDGWDQLLQIKCCDEEQNNAKPTIQLSVPSVVMFMPHDERFAIYDGDFKDTHALDRWISARRTPMVTYLTPSNAEHMFENHSPEKAPLLFLIKNKPEDAIETIMKEAAKNLRGRVAFCVAGTGSQIERRLMEFSGAEEEQLPVLTLIEGGGLAGGFRSSTKYRLPTQGLKAEHFKTFIDDYEGKRLIPWLKSEPEPQEDDSPVKMLVGTTFRRIARDEKKDVLVDFYAPWCGHCRKFEPLYKELAKKLKHVKTISIAKIDATRNEIEGMTIMSFPTIILFTGGGQEQIPFQGSRQPDDIVRWLHQRCHFTFDDTPPPAEASKGPADSGLLDETEEDL
jgi:protein disulfide-isomerase A1